MNTGRPDAGRARPAGGQARLRSAGAKVSAEGRASGDAVSARSREALDVSQEAFIKAYRALPSFRGESAFYTWLYRIAINTVKNHLVAQGRRPPTDDIDAQDAEQFSGDTGLKEYATPEHLLLRDEIERTITDAIEALPEELRTAITLRELEGLSYEEIAQAMDPPSAPCGHGSSAPARPLKHD